MTELERRSLSGWWLLLLLSCAFCVVRPFTLPRDLPERMAAHFGPGGGLLRPCAGLLGR